MENNNYNNFAKQKIIIFIVLLLLLFLIPIVLFIHSRVNSATVDLLVAPESSTIHIDSHKVTNGKIRVTPGKHTITAKKDGFEEKSLTVEVLADQTAQAYIILESNDDSTKNWYKNHPEDQKIVEQISSQEYDEESSKYTDDNPIIKYLPFETANYSINYGSCDSSSFCLFIETRPKDYNLLINNVLKQLTDDLARYSYVFSDYKNPFENTKTISKEPEAISSSDTSSARSFVENTFKSQNIKVIDLRPAKNYIVGSFSYEINSYHDKNTYRFVLQKNNGNWGFSVIPQMILTYIDNKDIPQEVIKEANNL